MCTIHVRLRLTKTQDLADRTQTYRNVLYQGHSVQQQSLTLLINNMLKLPSQLL